MHLLLHSSFHRFGNTRGGSSLLRILISHRRPLINDLFLSFFLSRSVSYSPFFRLLFCRISTLLARIQPLHRSPATASLIRMIQRWVCFSLFFSILAFVRPFYMYVLICIPPPRRHRPCTFLSFFLWPRYESGNCASHRIYHVAFGNEPSSPLIPRDKHKRQIHNSFNQTRRRIIWFSGRSPSCRLPLLRIRASFVLPRSRFHPHSGLYYSFSTLIHTFVAVAAAAVAQQQRSSRDASQFGKKPCPWTCFFAVPNWIW